MYKYFLIFIFLFSILSCTEPADIDIIIKEYRIVCSKSDFDKMYKNYKEDFYIPITISLGNDSVKTSAKMRVRGDTSREDPKKSLKIKIDSLPLIDGKKILNFNAEYSDKSYIRQFISSSIMQEAGIKCYKTEYAKIYLNGKYLGLYLLVENIDEQYLTNNNLSKKGNLYKAKKDGACLSLYDKVDKIWEKKTNEKSGNEDLKNLIYDINSISDSEFSSYVKSNFVYDKLITLVALNMLLANGSTYYHNYYLYHHPSGKWEILPWDMDKTLSSYNWMPFEFDRTSSEWESDNVLIERMLLDKKTFAEIRGKIDELSENLVNLPKFEKTIDELETQLKTAIEQDKTDKIKNISDWKKTIKEEKEFLKNTYENLQVQFNSKPTCFKLIENRKIFTRNPSFSWHKSVSPKQKKITYNLYFGSDFLFENKLKTTVIKNITDTSYTFNKTFTEGKYYWKVTASDGEFETEGFNSKNIIEIKKPSILPSKISNTLILNESKSPYLISQNLIIDANGKLFIEKGVEILLSENANIEVYGQLKAIGTREKPINFRPEKDNSFFGWIYFRNPKEACEFNFANIYEGVIQSTFADLKIKNSLIQIKNKSQIKGKTRLCLLWVNYGNLVFRNNKMIGNLSVGEGINANFAKAIVENSSFENVADAIEFINISDGIINGNMVENSPDDAIDLNACKNVKITNNTLINNKDKGISIGAEQYGASKNILVENNLIVGNEIGISVKDSSTATILNNTLHENNISIQLYKKRADYKIGGNAVVKNTIISKSKKLAISIDKFSNLIISNSICDTELLKGEGNENSNPDFVSTENFNFSLNKPNGKGILNKK